MTAHSSIPAWKIPWTEDPDVLQSMGSQNQTWNKDWFLLGKKHCHLAYLTYMQSTSCEIVGWMTHKLESKFLEEISTTLDMQDDTTLMAESEEELKHFLRE